MDFILNTVLRKHIFLVFIMCFCFVNTKLRAQCNFSPVSASVYFSNDCNGSQFQVIRGTPLAIYGNNGTLFFTSTLTSDIIITKTDEFFFPKILIYPNPAISILSIEWLNNEELQLSILSALGSEVKKFKISANSISTLDISDLPPGYYTLISKTKNNQIFTNKLIKQ